MTSPSEELNARWDTDYLLLPTSDTIEDPTQFSQQSYPAGSSFQSTVPLSEAENESEVTRMRLILESDKNKCLELLKGIKKWHTEGWCELVDMVPSKDDGYIQLSYRGVNKVAILQHVVVWSKGDFLRRPDDQVSHLCHHPSCRKSEHVVIESAGENNRRKNCLVWIVCPHHPDSKIIVCQHSPRCIKFAEGFSSMDDLNARGNCS
jgi:hypothetical protein